MTIPLKTWNRGSRLTALELNRIMEAIRRATPVAGNGVRISQSNAGSVISCIGGRETAVPYSAPMTWKVRKHTTEGDSSGQWEIYLPTGCMSVGDTLTPINRPASEKQGHDGDPSGWYVLKLDEARASVVETETEGEGEDAATTRWKVWDIVAHAKTSAKVYGSDTVDATSRRLLYVSARARLTSQESQAQTDAEKVADTWGDEFAQTVAVVRVGERTKGEKTTTVQSVTQAASAPISVQGRAPAGFDLVWYFGVANDGGLSVERVLCVRTVAQAAGMALTGPQITEVQGATNGIWAKIVTNPLAHQNQVEVVVDPTNTQGGDFLTWLQLYGMTSNAVSADYRTTALANLQVYR